MLPRSLCCLASLLTGERTKIAEALEPVEFQDGETVVLEGDKGDQFFIVTEVRYCMARVCFLRRTLLSLSCWDTKPNELRVGDLVQNM